MRTANLYDVSVEYNGKKTSHKVIGEDISSALWNLKQGKRPDENEYDTENNNKWYSSVDGALNVELIYKDVCI